MDTPRVSVLMAAYNAAPYLEEAIDSVLAQTMPEFELIVIDDGSTDATQDILARKSAQDARVVPHRQANKGIGGATNRALDLARAEYIAILDSDDTMVPERLARQTAYLDKHPEISAVGSQWFTMDTQSRLTGLDRHPIRPEAARSLMFAYFSLHHPAIMARKSAVLGCGKYDKKKRQGCRDYEVFSNLALAGYQFANLPQVLMHWRLNPSGVTHGKARAQTEDCLDIRNQAFTHLMATASDEAREVAKQLVRMFPSGSWFDDKAAGLIPNLPPSPARALWQKLADQGDLPTLEIVTVDWLTDEAPNTQRLADELHRSSHSWLASLVRARAGGPLPVGGLQSLSGFGADEAHCALTVLVPTQVGDADLPERVKAALAHLPVDGEIVVFTTDKRPIQATLLPEDPRLRCLASPEAALAPPGAAWLNALLAARGRHIAWLETGQRHHPDFLKQALARLDMQNGLAVVYGPMDRFYADVQDAQGELVKDPGPEPRWTRETLLGRDQATLGAMVHRRDALADLPLNLTETGSETAWCLARYLLIRHTPSLLDLRNVSVLPAIELSNRIMPTLTHRLLKWFLDSGLGCVPAEYAWSSLDQPAGRARLKRLATTYTGGQLGVHPGNFSLLMGFTLRFSDWPILDRTFQALLNQNPDAAIKALGAAHPLQVPLASAWRQAARLKRKLFG